MIPPSNVIKGRIIASRLEKIQGRGVSIGRAHHCLPPRSESLLVPQGLLVTCAEVPVRAPGRLGHWKKPACSYWSVEQPKD